MGPLSYYGSSISFNILTDEGSDFIMNFVLVAGAKFLPADVSIL